MPETKFWTIVCIAKPRPTAKIAPAAKSVLSLNPQRLGRDAEADKEDQVVKEAVDRAEGALLLDPTSCEGAAQPAAQQAARR